VLKSARQAVCEWREACGVWPTSTLPTVLVASKGDMVHLRQVTKEEGESYLIYYLYILLGVMIMSKLHGFRCIQILKELNIS
jgi:hypothetical protein